MKRFFKIFSNAKEKEVAKDSPNAKIKPRENVVVVITSGKDIK